MERINIIIDDPAARFGPFEVCLTGLGRVRPEDGEMSVDGYGFNGDDWAWRRTGWYAWYHHNHPASWAYVYDFSDGRQGISRVSEVNAALGAVGARFDPAGPPDPLPPPVTSDPILERLLDEEERIARGATGFREALIREMERNIRRPVADSLPTITQYHVRNPGGINYYTVASGNSYTTIRTADGHIRAVRLDEEGAPY